MVGLRKREYVSIEFTAFTKQKKQKERGEEKLDSNKCF